jgi:hypothetical protein
MEESVTYDANKEGRSSGSPSQSERGRHFGVLGGLGLILLMMLLVGVAIFR